MSLTMEQKKKAAQIHYGNFVWDYYPLGIPLIIDKQINDYVSEELAHNVNGANILCDLPYLYLEDMESGSERGILLKNKLEKSIAKSGVNCVSLTMGNTSRPLNDYKNVTASIAWWKRFFRTFDLMVECHTPEEVEEAYKKGKVSVIFCLQDGGCIGADIGVLKSLHEMGVRFIQVSFNKANSIGHGSTEPKEKGLTAFGKEVIKQMNELGIIVDVGHSNYQTTLDAINVSNKPVMVSHSACKSVFMHGRSKTDEELKALAEKDGFFGLLLVPSFISAEPNPGFDVVIRHLRHAVSIMGIDRVGIASDWGHWSPDTPKELTEAIVEAAINNLGLSQKMNLVAGTAPGAMKDYSDMYMITEALVEAGFKEDEIKKLIGKNFIDFWKRATV